MSTVNVEAVMSECPKCRTKLVEQASKRGLLFVCPSCNGRAMSINALRKADIDTKFLTAIWEDAHNPKTYRNRPCPHCGKPMAQVDGRFSDGILTLDICTICHSVWFDPREEKTLPHKLPKPKEKPLAPKSELVLKQLERETEEVVGQQLGDEPSSPLNKFLWTLGLAPVYNDSKNSSAPRITWGLAALLIIFTIVLLFRLRTDINEMGFLPSLWSRLGLLTIITSLIIDIEPLRLIFNVWILLVIGDCLEGALGRWKFLAIFMTGHLTGIFVYKIFLPNTPTVYFGAGAAIAALLAYNAVVYPRNLYSIFPGKVSSPYYMRWQKAVIGPSMLIAVFIVGQIVTAIGRRDYSFGVTDRLYICLISIVGAVPGLLAGLWHRASEKKKCGSAGPLGPATKPNFRRS